VLAQADDGPHQRAFDLVGEGRAAEERAAAAAVGERGGRGTEAEEGEPLRDAQAAPE